MDNNPLEEIDFLPNSNAFEQLVQDTAMQRNTFWTTEDIIEIDESRLPTEVTDGFYFGARTQITNVSAELSEYTPDGQTIWFFGMKFDVNQHFSYEISATNQSNNRATMLTTDSYGNTIRTSLGIDSVMELLIVMYHEHKNKIRGDEGIDILALARERHGTTQVIGSGMYNLLMEFAEISGNSNSNTFSKIHDEDKDKTIFATYSKKLSPHSETNDIDIDMAYEDPDEPDRPLNRLEIHVGASLPEQPSDKFSYARQSELPIDLDTFRDYRLIPGLMPGALGKVELLSPHDAGYYSAAELCMNALRNCLRPYRLEDDDIDNDFVLDLEDPIIEPDGNQEPYYEDRHDLD